MANSARTNTLRIIGGEHRGRKLHFPSVRGLRPTADRVRETLFNWLQHEVGGARCLDLFAGSGALGLEALSRGAASITMLDTARSVIDALHAHAEMLHLTDRVAVLRQDATRYLQRPGDRSFDIVFCDPPFAAGLLAKTCALLADNNWLAPGAFVYLEQDSAQPWPDMPDGWEVYREGRAGQAAFRLIRTGPILVA